MIRGLVWNFTVLQPKTVFLIAWAIFGAFVFLLIQSQVQLSNSIWYSKQLYPPVRLTTTVVEVDKSEESEEDWMTLSTCSDSATKLGPGQKVISFSLFTSTNRNFTQFSNGLERNLERMENLYPGWVVRVYTNMDQADQESISDRFTKPYPFLYWCQVENLPGLGNVSQIPGMCWRFLVLGDPLVDIFLSRDLDSTISRRERMAVRAWENSDFKLHTMRDHRSHYGAHALMGGMWGAKNFLIGKVLSKTVQQNIIQMSRNHSVTESGIDQTILLYAVYPRFYSSTLAHDTYLLGGYPDGLALPFPEERQGNFFVGQYDF